MDTKHTPGPWHVSGSEVNVADSSGMILAECGSSLIKNSMGGKDPRNRNETKANAALIAAAPELAEALASTLNAMRDLIRQIPADVMLLELNVDINFGGCDFAEGQAIKALNKAGYGTEA